MSKTDNKIMKALWALQAKAVRARQAIHVQAIMPRDVIDSRVTDYTPWYLCHTDPHALSQEKIDELWEEFREEQVQKFDEDERSTWDGGDIIESFFDYIRPLGYLSLHSAYEPYVTVDRDSLIPQEDNA